ncbi:hypothetical protein K227x_11230 [Rubripirellula lacrimiformis]|uniref:MgtE intracellular N domain protein n=1 Tax=Rubripirellula lacrimiformis TaxID=1930273 RepID=A0A517N6J9_9BACT|nr:hypothetical protein [Rubripirellula lacrimiformis]QDT02745.1 hypothetical protein K227x_11230 [Rubripirellula lacrimiformis]
MIQKLLNAFVAFSVATVITQLILFGYILTRGHFSSETVTKVIALVNGIDITGNRLQQILRQSEDREQPDFDEILEARKLEGYDSDIRIQSQQTFRDELSTKLADLRTEQDRFDERRTSFKAELQQIREGSQKKGLQDVQRTLQALDPVQAKEQLLIMYDDERIDDVVTIIQAMSGEKRKDILAEFVSKDETEKLAEILRQIGEGMPTTSLINQAVDGL